MAGIYVRFGPGPWFADDDQGVVADGALANGNLIDAPTVDGIGAGARPKWEVIGGLVRGDNATGLVRGSNT